MYGSTEGTVGLINTQNKVGAIGFISRFVPFLPVTLIKLDKNGDPIRDAKTGLCVHCKPGEEGEVIGLVRPDDRGGPEKFQVYQKTALPDVVFLVQRLSSCGIFVGLCHI